MNILILAIEDERQGPVRLAKYLQRAGLKVAALSGQRNPLQHSQFVERHFNLPVTRNGRLLASAVEAAVTAWSAAFVIPADEQMFALLAAVLAHPETSIGSAVSDSTRSVLLRSLGPISTHQTKLSKNAAQRLARSVGVTCAPGDAVVTKDEALRLASDIGFPVVLKKSFSWAGAGVRVCSTPEDVARTFDEFAPRSPLPGRNVIRQMTGRAWYPEPEPVWVQKAIDGVPAMYTFFADDGQVLAGFSALKRRTTADNGPSSVIECLPNDQLSAASAALAEGMGSVGFNSFDFMIETKTGRSYFLECNPRPNPVSHLGAHLGMDFCQCLARMLCDEPRPRAGLATARPYAQTIALFPQEWRRDADSPFIQSYYHDVPWDDARLVAYLMSSAAA